MSTAPAGGAAFHAAVAGAVAGHDAAADAAAGGVAHVVHGLHGRGRVVQAAVFGGLERAALLDAGTSIEVRSNALGRRPAVVAR